MSAYGPKEKLNHRFYRAAQHRSFSQMDMIEWSLIGELRSDGSSSRWSECHETTTRIHHPPRGRRGNLAARFSGGGAQSPSEDRRHPELRRNGPRWEI